MSECTHDCSTCGADCASRNQPESLLEPQNAHSNVRKVIAVMSGKGGVGKSLVTSLLAVLTKRNGLQTAVLDADITGPSIPKIFGVKDKAMGTVDGILPAETKTGIKLMSVNLLLENDTDPVIWRGALIAGTVKQFWTDVVWGDVDYEHPGAGHCGEHELCGLPGLREEDLPLRGEPDGEDRDGPGSAAAGAAADRSGDRKGMRHRRDRAVQ